MVAAATGSGNLRVFLKGIQEASLCNANPLTLFPWKITTLAKAIVCINSFGVDLCIY